MKFNYHDVDVVPITIIFNMVCKLVISKIGGTYSIFRTLISTIVVKENIIQLAKEDNSSAAFK